jgi:hypothetical protein
VAAEASFFLALCLLSFSIAGKKDLTFSGALLSSLSLSARSAPLVHLGPVRSHSLSLSLIFLEKLRKSETQLEEGKR